MANKYDFSDLTKYFPEREYKVMQYGFSYTRKTGIDISINSLRYLDQEFGLNFYIEVF